MHKLQTNAYKSLIWMDWEITESYIDGTKDKKRVLSVKFDMFQLGLPWFYQNNTFWWIFVILIKQNMICLNEYPFRLMTVNVWNTIMINICWQTWNSFVLSWLSSFPKCFWGEHEERTKCHQVVFVIFIIMHTTTFSLISLCHITLHIFTRNIGDSIVKYYNV